GATIVIESQGIIAGAKQWAAAQWTETDAQGHFALSIPSDVPMRLLAPQLSLTSSPDPFTLAPGEARTIELMGARRPVFKIAVRLDRPGVNLGFVSANLERADSPPARPFVVADTRADASGAFTFVNVPDGRYRIKVDTAAVTTGYAPSDVLSGAIDLDV